MYSDTAFDKYNKKYLANLIGHRKNQSKLSKMSMSPDADYYVIKRDGSKAPVRFDAITERNQLLCSSIAGHKLKHASQKLTLITQKVVERFRNGMTTHELDMLTASVCAERSTYHPDYSDLAARIMVSNLQKTTANTMEELIEEMSQYKSKTGKPNCRLRDEFLKVVKRASVEIDRRIVESRDYSFTAFAIQTCQKSYLLRNIDHESSDGGKNIIPAERPQFMYMRIALFLFVCNAAKNSHELSDEEFRARLEDAFKMYDMLSTFKITHASPTVFNSGTLYPQLSSCFLLGMDDDFDTIFKVICDAAKISKYGGGVGIDYSRLRPEGSIINSSGGYATGVTFPLLNLVNADQLYARQLGGRRNGAFVGYLPPWHPDFIDFVSAGRHVGVAKTAKDIKYAAWISDLFMRKTLNELKNGPDHPDSQWYQFGPDVCPELIDAFGEEFDRLYDDAVQKKKYANVTTPSKIWKEMFITTVQRGFPYVLYKDHINNRSNLSHDRTIRTSNLCAEITIPYKNEAGKPDEAEYGTCNLGAIPLASHVVPDETAKNKGRVRMNWQSLFDAARMLTRSINKVIELSYYPTDDCRRSNDRYRPLAIGIMGLADVFAMFKYSFDDKEALDLDEAIQAVIYYGAMFESSEMGKQFGNFEAFEGSAANRGLLQPDMSLRDGYLDENWDVRISETTSGFLTPSMWASLRENASKYLYNSYVTANMPTATSSQVTGQNECFEPFTHNTYARKTTAGEFVILNRYLQQDLEVRGIWSEEMREKIISNNGSIQTIMEIPEDIRRIYRCAREYDQRVLIKHAAVRTPFVSQSQSLNIYMDEVTMSRYLTNMIYGWEQGVTTGAYYTHTKPAVGSIQSVITSRPENVSEVVDDIKEIKLNPVHKKVWKPLTFDLTEEEMGACSGGGCAV